MRVEYGVQTFNGSQSTANRAMKKRDVFELEGREFIELDNLLKVTGLCDSGGSAKTVIAEGRVTVDGRVELRRRCKLRTGQVVTFEGHTVAVK